MYDDATVQRPDQGTLKVPLSLTLHPFGASGGPKSREVLQPLARDARVLLLTVGRYL